jgi:hypothetical protein
MVPSERIMRVRNELKKTVFAVCIDYVYCVNTFEEFIMVST